MNKVYRIWDNKYNCYVEKDEVNRSYYLNKIGEVVIHTSYQFEDIIDLPNKESVKRFVVELNTRIKDKDQNYIFEGDIIQYTDNFSSYNDVIQWKDDTWGWDIPKCNVDFDEFSVKIIGNIHQNKELLNS